MSDFIFGAFVTWIILAVWKINQDAVGIVIVAISLFIGGWNWAKFAIKKGWIKSG